MSSATQVPPFVRASLLGIVLFGLVGLIIELVFLKHTDGSLELLPIWLMVGALAVVIWDGIRRSAASRGMVALVMAAFVVTGLAGVILHYRANVGYEQDSNPGEGKNEVYKKAVMGATPTLAPGAMVELGLVGLLFALLQPTPTEARVASKGNER
jgi:hypothetical protein